MLSIGLYTTWSWLYRIVNSSYSSSASVTYPSVFQTRVLYLIRQMAPCLTFYNFSQQIVGVQKNCTGTTGNSHARDVKHGQGASIPYKRWSKCTMEKVGGKRFCRNLGGSALIINALPLSFCKNAMINFSAN